MNLHFRSGSAGDLLKKMKLLIAFFFTGLLGVSASTYSQQTKLSLKFDEVTVKEAFKLIEKNSEFVFFYNEDYIDVYRKVSLNANDEKVESILNVLLNGTQNTFKIYDRQIVILPPDAKESPAVIKLETNAEQKKKISGSVKDTKGLPLPGVSVVVKGTTIGIITDADGQFSLSVPADAKTLAFSFIGMTTQEIEIGANTTINVILVEKAVGIEEVVAVGYGVQKKLNLTGSVAKVEGSQLSIAPLASTANTLAGRLSGLISIQSSGQPGADAAALSIRGFGNALVIVDGVETKFNNIDPNAIESVSILKDGAASIYGSRAGNGVILVTTKRGKNEKPTITFNSSSTIQGITIMPKPSSSGQYTEMISEAYLQSGHLASDAPYSPEQIQKYYEGTDPLYPNTDWYHVLIRKWAPQQQHNLSVRGGSDKIKYYGFVGYVNQGSIWKNNGGDYSRYNLQSNIDAKITDDLSLQLDISSTDESTKTTWRPQNSGYNTVWQDFWNTLPMYPATFPDPTKISFANGGGTGGAHIISNRDIAGYVNYDNQDIKGTMSLNYNVSAVKGLSAKAFINVLQNYGQIKNFSKPVQFYTYDPSSDIYTLKGALGSNASMVMQKSQSRVITSQFSVNYDRIFSEDHHITALGLYEAINYSSDYLTARRANFLTPAIDQLFAGSTNGMSNDGSATEMGRKSYVGRLNYSFKNKYLVGIIMRADASAKFPSDKRWGYFPGVSAGWRINQENFMHKFKNLDNLKIRVSYGESGNDGVGNFQYLSGYQFGSAYVFNGNVQPALASKGLANPNLTWEKIKIYNLGTDFSFWNRKLYGEFDAFYRTRIGIPTTRIASLPSTFGSSLPPENINSLNDRGFELRLGTAGDIKKDLFWDISGNLSWSRAKWDHYDEPDYSDPDQARISKKSGRWTDRFYGYLSDGLFTSQDEINKLAFDQDGQKNITLRPGDIKFKDVNGDGKLDWKDQVEIGKGTTPHWMLGINTDLKYKNFDLSALFQGAFGYYNYITLQHGGVPPVEYYNERWTQANNNPNALVPRLGGVTSGVQSDYYYKKAGYLRLKVLSFGYNLPKNVLDKIGFSQLRIYMAATNLLTFDKLKKYSTDPESPSGNAGFYYPQQKTITLGINLSL